MSDPTPSREQNYYPLSHLPMFTQLIDEHLENDHEQLAVLQRATPKPYVLDDETVTRIINLYSESEEIRGCYQRQLDRWKNDNPTTQQHQEITRLEQQVQQLGVCQNNILTLAKQLEGQTIEKMMAKSDTEIALEFLSGQFGDS